MMENSFLVLDDNHLSEPNVFEYVIKPKFLSQPGKTFILRRVLNRKLINKKNKYYVNNFELRAKIKNILEFDLSKYVSDTSSEILSLNETEEKENKLVSPGFVVLPPIKKAKTCNALNELKSSEDKDNATMERKFKNSFTGMLEQLNEDVKINNSAKVMSPDQSSRPFERQDKAVCIFL